MFSMWAAENSVCVSVCAHARVYLCAHCVRSHTYTKKRSLSSFLRICSCDVNKGQVLPPGRILKTLLVPKNVDMKKQPTGPRHAQRSAHNAHMCVRGERQRGGRVRWKDGRHAQALCEGTM